MFWMLVCVGGAVALMLLSGGGRDGLDYRAREVRASIARRDALDIAQMRRLRWARRRQNLLHMQ